MDAEAEARIQALTEELAAARRTIDALVRRAERVVGADAVDRFAVMKAMASLEDDIAARTRELERSEAHFRALWDHSPDMLLLVDAEGALLATNPAAAEIARGVRRVWEVFADPDAARELHARGFRLAGLDGLALRGGRVVLAATAGLGEGQTLLVLREVTAYRAIEAELEATRSLARLGQFATTIANSINNPLAVILGRVELMQALGPDAAEDPGPHLEVIADHARRIAGVIDAVLSFARPSRGRREVVDLDEALGRAVAACGRRLGELRVDVQAGSGEPARVLADPVQLEQAFVAIVGGLAEALHRRGRIRVARTLQRDRVTLAFFNAARGQPPRGMQRWLDAPEAGGLEATSAQQMGMIMAANILREHGGGLHLAPPGTEGELLRASLPCAGGERALTSRRVLVVDGQGELGGRVAGMLALDPVELVEVRGVEEAMGALAEGSYDLVLSLVGLPDGSGPGLWARVGRRWPGLERRVVLVSGSGSAGLSGVRALRRPFDREALLQLFAD